MSHSPEKEINPSVNTNELVAAKGTGDASGNLRYASDPPPEHDAALPPLRLSPADPSQPYDDRCRQILLLAEEAFAKTGSWVVFFREILGAEGAIAELFADPDERSRFIAGPEFATLHTMLAAIRSQDDSKSDAAEPERMITIRIPRSLHQMLAKESESCDLSINKLAISKLLLPANPKFVPEQRGKRRGRKPGPQGTRNSKNEAADQQDPGQTTQRVLDPQTQRKEIDGRVVSYQWGNNQ